MSSEGVLRDFPEEFVLLQWERALLREVNPQLRGAILEYQATTMTSLFEGEGVDLQDVFRYERSSIWRRGWARLREMGLVDAKGRVTWAQPRWSGRVLREAQEIASRLCRD